MSIYLTNLKKYLQKITPFSRIILLISLLVVSVLLYGKPISAGPYLDSAHGNTSYGVNRPRTAGFGYTVGNCAHCHEQHSSIGGQTITPYDYELWRHWPSTCNIFCYFCHSDVAETEQVVLNYPYSYNFGGAPSFHPTVYKQFCEPFICGSSHNLQEIQNLIENNGNGWGFPADPNPCSACHNPHLAQRIGGKQHSFYDPSKSTITRPSEHYNNPLNLWGDEAGERMSDYAASVGGTYQAPYFGSGSHNPTTGPFEPAGNSTKNGSNLPDYVTFCLDCHQNRIGDTSAIKWSESGLGWDHGARAAGKAGDTGSLKPPYSDDAPDNYVLCCTDCHEPHGSKQRQYLLRRYVNGTIVGAEDANCSVIGPEECRTFCLTCHDQVADHYPGFQCFSCHQHGDDF